MSTKAWSWSLLLVVFWLCCWMACRKAPCISLLSWSNIAPGKPKKKKLEVIIKCGRNVVEIFARVLKCKLLELKKSIMKRNPDLLWKKKKRSYFECWNVRKRGWEVLEKMECWNFRLLQRKRKLSGYQCYKIQLECVNKIWKEKQLEKKR